MHVRLVVLALCLTVVPPLTAQSPAASPPASPAPATVASDGAKPLPDAPSQVATAATPRRPALIVAAPKSAAPRTVDAKYVAWVGGTHGLLVAYTIRFNNCYPQNCVEVSHLSPPAFYGAFAGLHGLMAFTSYEMKKAGKWYWWTPQLGLIALHIYDLRAVSQLGHASRAPRVVH